MKKIKEIVSDVYYVGVNDRRKPLFENLWPIPDGITYNSYFINDEKTVLIDTVDICYSEQLFAQIAEVLNGRPLDYLIVNHMEPDHSGSIGLLRKLYPEIKIVGNKSTFGMLEGFYGVTGGLHEVKDGDTLDIGSRKLKFITAPMVHWPEVMFTYDDKDKILFSADAFGSFGALNGSFNDKDIKFELYFGEMIRYYSNVVGKYGTPVRRALKKIESLPIDIICSTHGAVLEDRKNTAIKLYDKLSQYEAYNGITIIYGSMYGHTEKMAETIAQAISDEGVREIAIHDVNKSDPSYILRDVFYYKGLIVGSPTYSMSLYPKIDYILKMIEVREVKNRLFGHFSSFTWANAAAKKLTEYGEMMKWQTIGTPVEQKQNADSFDMSVALGKEMAKHIK
jgi:flavorubredoxin